MRKKVKEKILASVLSVTMMSTLVPSFGLTALAASPPVNDCDAKLESSESCSLVLNSYDSDGCTWSCSIHENGRVTISHSGLGDGESCSYCGYTKPAADPDPDPVHEHTYANEWSTSETEHWHAATCEHSDEKSEIGYHSFYDGSNYDTAQETCSTCGYRNSNYVSSSPESHTHSFSSEWTYDDNGHYHICTVDGCDISDYATCGVEGVAYAAHVYDQAENKCICGKVDPNASQTNPTPEDPVHSCSTSTLTIQSGQAATCSAAGFRDYYKCSCGKFFSDADAAFEIVNLDDWKNGDGKIDIDASAHDFSDNAQTCKNGCGTENPNYHGTHVKGTHHDVVSATCTTTGTKEYWDCTCGVKLDVDGNVVTDESLVIEIDSNAHAFSATISSDSTGHWYAATCGHDVKKDIGAHTFNPETGICTVCNYVCTHSGQTTGICSVCGKTLSSSEAHTHTLSDWQSNSETHYKVCTKEGCPNAGTRFNEEAHSYSNGKCKCGKVNPTSYTVTFNANGHGTVPSAVTVTEGTKVQKPSDPTATGYTFKGWYRNSECTESWSFSENTVTKNMTLYAKWEASNATATAAATSQAAKNYAGIARTNEGAIVPTMLATGGTKVSKAYADVIPAATYNFNAYKSQSGFAAGISKVIMSADANATEVAIYSDNPVTFNADILSACKNSKVDVVYYFTYQGHLYSVTIPAGADTSNALEANGNSGPLYVGMILGTSVLIR